MAEDFSFGAVQAHQACPEGDQCTHCKAGRIAIPAEAGDPRELSGGIWELDDALRHALPPTYHRPAWVECSPPGWFCACCWDEGTLTAWPCLVAARHGTYVRRSMELEFTRAQKAGLALTV